MRLRIYDWIKEGKSKSCEKGKRRGWGGKKQEEI